MLFNPLGDELFSDSYRVKTVDEVFYEVEGKASVFVLDCTGRVEPNFVRGG